MHTLAGWWKRSQESCEFSESESWSIHEKEVTGKLVASRTSGNSENPKAESRKWPHNFHMYPAVVPHIDEVYSIVRKIYGRSPTGNLNDIDVNTAVWEKFLSVTLQAAVHSWSRLHGEFTIYQESTLEVCKKVIPSDWKVDRRSKRSIIWPRLISKSLLGDRRVYFVTQLLRLRMPKPMSSPTRCSVWEAWETNRSKPDRYLKDLNRIDGERMEFEWKYSQDSLRWASSKRFKNLWQNHSVNLSSSKTGSSSCQCTTTLYGENKETQTNRIKFSYSCELCSQIPARTLVTSDAWIRDKPDGDWDKNCWTNDAETFWKQSSDVACRQCPGKRRIKKQRKGKEVYSLQR